MLFPKYALKHLAGYSGDGPWGEPAIFLDDDSHVENRRWVECRRMVFHINGDIKLGIGPTRYFYIQYEVGLTENQDTEPFDYDPEEIECVEVRQVEKTVIVWEVI